MTDLRWPSWASGGLLAWGVACAPPRPSPFTPAETDAALAPARDLWSRCYAGTELERQGRLATLDYSLDVAADGSVTSVPRRVEPDLPVLVECARERLNQLRFPVRGRDHLDVHFELGPRGAEAGIPRAAEPRAAGTCEPACRDGYSCHYEASAPRGVCRVTSGRCRFGRDCAPSQACQRQTELLGVCVDPRP
ncbi:MAG: hypothetical protein EOO73_00385 [Myxococcales bacterium]|nr:MAG: hypothetical protein EOO73_00385 [Myxococcales bacterium]